LLTIANFIICSGAFACLTILFGTYARGNPHPAGVVSKYYVGTLTGLLFLALVLHWFVDNKRQLARMFATVAVSIYGAELILFLMTALFPSFNPRTQFHVAQELRVQGVEAYPVVNPASFISNEGLSGIFPFSGIANKLAVHCHEAGERFTTYVADDHGFNNPRWEDNPEIVLIGDSFTQGACVERGDDIASQLRHGGKSVVTLGSASAGPLIELAILREYATHLKPKILLWVYYEGTDLPQLEVEQKSSLLKRYFTDETFTQNLIVKQPEIDRALTERLDQVLRAESERERLPARLVSAIKLSGLRSRLSLIEEQDEQQEKPPAPGHDFSGILRKADDRIRGWGGQMYFVYLPSYGRYAQPVDENAYRRRREVLDLVRGLNIPVIDVHQVFAAHPDPLSLFPHRSFGHYTPEGYRLVAEYIRSKL
jgi:hypothetical protein